jgi:hypothetical protein
MHKIYYPGQQMHNIIYIYIYIYIDNTWSFTVTCTVTKENIDRIPIYIQQDATLNSLFISRNCSTCFGWYFHPSSEAHTTVSTASGMCQTVTATCRYSGR